jgi:chlorobactene glucosyltransferase
MENILEIAISVYHILLVGVALYFFVFSLANHYEMWRFTLPPEMLDGPFVSVLIPARNEEENIERCLLHLLNQNYRNFEILVLNDNSTDNTLKIISDMAAKNSRIKALNGASLPQEWFGKPFALHQLYQEAKGEILLFTDADTVHRPTSISWAVTNLVRGKVDMVSGYVGQELPSIGEIITVPLMFFLTGFVIPLFLNRFTRKSWFSSAIGQYIAIRRDVFTAIGGCETFKRKTTEEVYMARYVKKQGYKTRFLDITEHVSCRMYIGYQAAVAGIGKNIFDFLGKSSLLLFLIAIAVLFFLFFPFPLLFISIIRGSVWLNQVILVNILYTLTWLFMFLNHRVNWWNSLLWPIMFLNLLYMAFWSWFRTISGRGFVWKGRVVN